MSRSRVSQLVTAAAPLLAAGLVAKLWLTGTLGFYVNSRTIAIVLAGAVLFALVGIVALRAALRTPDRGAHLSWKTIAFLVPVVAGLLIPGHPLSATSGQASSLGGLQLAAHVSSGGSGDSFGGWISSLGSHPDEAWWAGQHVTLVGFAANQVGLPRRSFIVGRYLVTCCVVDATLLGFPVQLAGNKMPPDGSWVQVHGVFGRQFWTDATGSRWPMIVHAHLSPVSIPSSPYLSP